MHTDTSKLVAAVALADSRAARPGVGVELAVSSHATCRAQTANAHLRHFPTHG